LSKHTLRLVAIATLTTLSTASQAITFEQLDASGNGSGVFYTPSLSDWVMAPGSADSNLLPVTGGWQVGMGLSSFGAAEDGFQLSDVYGAGVVLPSSDHGWRINFSANLRTWDSYNDGSVVLPNPGASLGDWDLFAVNANRQGFYWNLTSTTAVFDGGGDGDGELMPTALLDSSVNGLLDPLLPVRPAGTVVSYTNTTQDPAYLPGSTWAWGGRDYAAGYFESISTSGQVLAAGGAPTFVSFVLDSRTPYNNDNRLPSWGQFGPSGAFSNVPDGSVPGDNPTAAPGYSFSNPLLPIEVGEQGQFIFNEVVIGDTLGASEFLYLDPEVAVGYTFTVSGGPSFKEILLPQLGDPDGYDIQVLVDGEWVTVGQVADGGAYTFDEPVAAFRVMGISASLGLNPNNIAAFTTGVKMDSQGVASFTMTPNTVTTPVPEPGTVLLAGMGLLTLALARRRR
jgi:PEP-CTERM motif